MEKIRSWLIMSVAVAGAVGLLAGCTTPGRRLNSSDTRDISQGKTREEVHRLLGSPKCSEVGSDGRRLDLYQVIAPKPSVAHSAPSGIGFFEVRSCHVLYDAQGRVENTAYSIGELERTFGLGGSLRFGRPFTPEKLNQIRPRVTQSADLVKLFGRETSLGLDVRGRQVMTWLFMEGRKPRLTFDRGQELCVLLDSELGVLDFAVREIRP